VASPRWSGFPTIAPGCRTPALLSESLTSSSLEKASAIVEVNFKITQDIKY